jgi:RNA polymerase sigma-70 factor (ECF subfamily)
MSAIATVDAVRLDEVDGSRDAEDERALVEQARVDPEAFAKLYQRYVPRVYAFAFRRTGVVEAAEDVTSAAFERALRNLDSFRWQPGGFGPWLFRIASNELVNHYRHAGRASTERGKIAARRLHDTVPADPADLVGARAEAEELLAAMDRLSPRYQQALSLRYLAGLSPAEAATALGTSKATFAVVTFRATRALRRELEKRDQT